MTVKRISTGTGIAVAIALGVLIGSLTLVPIFASDHLTVTTSTSITADQAKAVVLAQYPGATITSIKLENEDGSLVYEIKLKTTDGKSLEVSVDVQTKAVLQNEASETESEDEHEAIATQASITSDQAKAAVLVQYPGATIPNVKLENDDGSLIYKIELKTTDGKNIEVKVDAQNGEIIQTETAEHGSQNEVEEQETPETSED